MRILLFAFLIMVCVLPLFAQDGSGVIAVPKENPMSTMGNVLQSFYYADGFQMLVPIMDVSGKQPLPDSCLIEAAMTKTPDQVDFWNDPHGRQLYNRWGDYYCKEHYTNGVESGMIPGFFYTDYFIWLDPFNSSIEPAAHCKHDPNLRGDQIYLRLFNGTTYEKSTHYRVSPFIDAPLVNGEPFEVEITQWGPWTPIPPKTK
jgi:hypothetical protein